MGNEEITSTERKALIRELEKERCRALDAYHRAAEKLDELDYRLFQLKKADKEKKKA